MLSYIVRRLALAIPLLIVLTVLSFILMRAAPGGPFTQERPLPQEVLDNINARYGLDEPLWKQIFVYLKNIVLHFDFGPSFVKKDLTVNEIIANGFPVTLSYGFFTFVVAVIFGVSLGIIAALRQNSWIDYIAVGFSVAAQALPNFIMAPLLTLVFTLIILNALPGGGWYHVPAGEEMSFFARLVTPDSKGWLYHHYLVMPVIALATSYFASIARITRSSMLEVLNSNYIRTARAKGLSESAIIWKHAIKPALLPVVSYLGPAFVGMITGSVVIDQVFTTGGIGQEFVKSAQNRDYSVIMGITLLVGFLTIIFNLLVDIIYAWLDPKIRY